MAHKYIPSEEVGEYEQYKKKDRKKGGLYPLNEEGEYGPPPSALPPPLPGYQKRERKPKVYASYAISSECEAHGEAIKETLSRNSSRSQSYQPPVRRASSYTRRSPAPSPSPAKERSYSQPRLSKPRQRSSSFRHISHAANHDSYSGKHDWTGSLRSSESPSRSFRACTPNRQRKTSRSSYRESVSPNRNQSVSPDRSVTPEAWKAPKKNERRSMSSDGMSQRSSQSSTDWGYTSYNSFTANKSSSMSSSSYSNNNMARTSGYSKYSSGQKDSSFDESYEEDYGGNYGYGSKSGSGKMALSSLKTPEINVWDNMGILGLSSKMYSETSSAKEGVFSSNTSGLFRRESVTSHVM